MNIKDLLLYNKEGNPLNLNYDESSNMWNGKMFFDKNSTDTFKTQGIYAFEKVPGSNNTLQTYLNKFQVFNTNGFLSFPVFGATVLEITNIETVTDSALYKTKWVYAVDIEKTYYPGMWVYFKGLSNDFAEYSTGLIKSRKILAVEPGRILIITDIANNIPIIFVPSPNKTIVPMNVLEVQQSVEPWWNESGLTSKLFNGKKLSFVVNSDNAGIYTVKEVVLDRLRYYTTLPMDLFVPIAGDTLVISLNLRTSNIPVSNGVTTFDTITVGNIISNVIQLPYVPSFLKIDDTIQAFTKPVINSTVLTITGINTLTNTITVATSLTSQTVDCIIKLSTNNNVIVSDGVTIFGNTTSNDIVLPSPNSISVLTVGSTIQTFAKQVASINTVTLNVTGINRLTNTITVAQTLTTQTVDCIVNLSTNILSIEQDIVLDNNNTYSLPLSYWTIVNKWNQILTTIPGGGRLEYNTNTDSLTFTSDFTDNYVTITTKVLRANGTVLVPVMPPVLSYNVFPIWLTESLDAEERIDKDTTIYNRQIVFATIDSYGLNVNINGVPYNVDTDINVSNTINDFISEYSTKLGLIGITTTVSTTVTPNDTLNISSDYPNVPVFTQLRLGDFSNYYVKYKDYQFKNIKSQLLITINEKDYRVSFNTTDSTTVTNWVNTHKAVLYTFGIVVSNNDNTLHVNILDPEKTLKITYNIGYIPKSGDLSVYETLFATSAFGSIISGNEIRCVTGTYNFDEYYSTGQKIAIDGALKLSQNKSYNIIGLQSDIISLSYQGAFWQQGLPLFSLHIVSDYFIRFPKMGVSDYSKNAKFIWSWKDTQINDFFFYDFSGNQLKPIYDNFPEYTGIKPLCGTNGEIELKLIKKPNDQLQFITDSTKQQTVFDVIEYTLPFVDDNTTNGVDPEPMQVFMGYRAENESWSKARLYLELFEDVAFNRTTSVNSNDLWVFKNNYVEIMSQSLPTVDFNVLGFRPGQIVKIDFVDVNNDGRKIAVLNNAGHKYKIVQVLRNKIIFSTDVLEETSIKSVPATTTPFYDITSNPLFVNRTLNVSLTVMPKVVAYIDMYGESEEEDIRHKINLNNRNFNILKLQDFYIFKDVDIKEHGIDWIILNRKRKELLEIYPEIFNNIASYKSVILAINFFGYNDLSFTEYFQNINPENTKFGQLFNMDLLNLFNKSVDGWEYSNLAFENLRNEGFRKTNLFSLNYRITDADGNFVSAYSMDEVRIKLLGLKRWLTENIIPIGTKIIDITGKYRMQQPFFLQHETYNTKNFRVVEYATPVDFKTTGYLSPINTGSNTYDISVDFFSAGEIEWFEYKIRTFYLDTWNHINTYFVGNVVYHNGVTWKCVINTVSGNEPNKTTSWIKTNIDKLPSNQIFRDYRHDDTETSFTVNKLVDPHFIIEVSWHSGYSSALLNRKAYSVIPNFFDKIK